MRQRLGLAQAIMEKPGLLILDEPFNGLDAEGVEQMRQCLLSLRQKNTTILMASHAREDIEILCDRVFTMEHGKIAPSDNT
jgi:ABC-2 type transport system ATP-binding protein